MGRWGVVESPRQANMNSSKQRRSIWRREVSAWCCYDWANSGYTTLLITVFVVYIQKVVFDVRVDGSTGAVVWAWSVAASMLIGGVLSPFAGAMADARGSKRIGLAVTAYCGGVACMTMALIPVDQTWLIVGCLVLANLSLELSLTFYNGFLPEVADESELNQVSALGMGWGYFGGGLGLLLAMLVLNFRESLGMADVQTALRVCIFATGVWWILFSVPVVWVLRDKPRQVSDTNLLSIASSAISDVTTTISLLRSNRVLLLFLIAFLIYNDGLQTVISQASTFALEEIQFAEEELVAVVLMIQFIATPGALLIGWLADFWGRKRVLIGCLCVWIMLLASAWFVQSKIQFWILAAGVAMVLGGTQSISRAIMGGLTPEGQEARYFGFFNLSGKATSFLGTFLFGLIVALTGSSRLAIVNLVGFFLVGLILISCTNLDRPSPNTLQNKQQGKR